MKRLLRNSSIFLKIGQPNKFRRNISEIIPDKTIPNAFTWMTF